MVDRSRQRDAFLTRDVFHYDRETDGYRCPAGEQLSYCGTRRAS